jgi:hypothetical protein
MMFVIHLRLLLVFYNQIGTRRLTLPYCLTLSILQLLGVFLYSLLRGMFLYLVYTINECYYYGRFTSIGTNHTLHDCPTRN